MVPYHDGMQREGGGEGGKEKGLCMTGSCRERERIHKKGPDGKSGGGIHNYSDTQESEGRGVCREIRQR